MVIRLEDTHLQAEAHMRRLTFRLFGGFEARRSAGPPVLPTNKARALLAYLACTPGQPHARDQIAALLWGDKEEKQARHSLRQVISSIRKAFPDESPECLLLEAIDTAGRYKHVANVQKPLCCFVTNKVFYRG